MRPGKMPGTVKLLQRDSRNRLENTAGDLVRIPLRIRTAVFEVTLVAAVHKAVRNANRRAAVCHAVVEFVDRLRLVQTGQTEVVVRTIDSDVLVLVLVER